MSVLTKKAIKEEFIKLLEKKPIDQITIRDITDSCGISRNTFYYHYADLPALVEEIIMEQAEEIIRRYPDVKSLEQALEVSAEFMMENRRSAVHILNSSHRYIYEQCLMKVCRHVVQAYVDVAIPSGLFSDEEKELMIEYYKCISFGIVVEWCDNGMKDNCAPRFDKLLNLRRKMLASGIEL